MNIEIDLYIYLPYEVWENTHENRKEFSKEYFETIKQYFLMFRQPPPIGQELWPEINGDARAAKVTRSVFYPDGSFLIDILCDDYEKGGDFYNNRFEFDF